MAKPIDQVAVLGAGVMGAAIAAHLANAGLKVLLLDIPAKDAPAGDRRGAQPDRRRGLERARKAKPAAFFSPRFETPGDASATSRTTWPPPPGCDFIIEAIIENLEIKRALYARLEALGGRGDHRLQHLGPAHRATCWRGAARTSGSRFCITHFFNPPRYLKLVEIVAGPDTAPGDPGARRGRCAAACSARAWSAPRTRPTSSPTASAPSRCCGRSTWR